MKTFKLAAGILPAVILAACGGGGGGGGGSNTTTVSGNALKGTVKNGRVEVFSLANAASLTDFSKATPIATTETDDKGNFSMPISDSAIGGNAIAIRITPKDNKGSSKLRCDARPNCGSRSVTNDKGVTETKLVGFRDFYDLPADFKMLTLLPAPKGSADVSVNPLTTVAAKRADERLQSDDKKAGASTAIRNANSEISKVCGGLDVSAVKPVDSADDTALKNASPDQQASSLLIAGLLAKNGGDPTAAIADFNYSNGAIPAQKLADIVTAARDQQSQAGVPESSSAYDNIDDEVSKKDGNGNVNQKPATDADLSNTDKGKKLVQDIRNFSQSVDKLAKPERDYLAQVDQATKHYDEVAGGLGDAFDVAIARMLDCADQLDRGQGTALDCNTPGNDGASNIKVHADKGADNTSVTGDVTVKGFRAQLSGSAPRNINTNAQKTMSATFSGSVAGSGPDRNQVNRALRLTIDQGSAVLTKTSATAFDPSDTHGLTADTARLVDNLTVTMQATLKQDDAATPVTFTGLFNLKIVGCAKCGLENETFSDGSGGKGQAGFLPTLFQLKGTLAQGSQSNVAEFKVTVDETSARNLDTSKPLSSSNTVIGSVSLKADITLSTQSASGAIVVATTGYDDVKDRLKGTAEVSFSTGNSTLKISANEGTADTDGHVLITVSSPNGTVATLDIDKSKTFAPGVIGRIKADNAEIANIERRSNGLIVVKYPDGTFETLVN